MAKRGAGTPGSVQASPQHGRKPYCEAKAKASRFALEVAAKIELKRSDGSWVPSTITEIKHDKIFCTVPDKDENVIIAADAADYFIREANAQTAEPAPPLLEPSSTSGNISAATAAAKDREELKPAEIVYRMAELIAKAESGVDAASAFAEAGAAARITAATPSGRHAQQDSKGRPKAKMCAWIASNNFQLTRQLARTSAAIAMKRSSQFLSPMEQPAQPSTLEGPSILAAKRSWNTSASRHSLAKWAQLSDYGKKIFRQSSEAWRQPALTPRVERE